VKSVMYKSIAILMATYNGEKYLKEQIDSILNQTYQDFVLYIRDDNSVDSTKKIIEDYKRLYPEKIVEVKDEKIARGACKNFMNLLEYVYNLKRHDLFMFADQDDFWLKNKVEITVKEYNKISNTEQPILVHTDLNVVDSDLNLISKSFINYSSLNSNCKEFNKYLIQNNVTGCTMLINEKLVELVKFDIENIRMHDWYFALIASAFGKVIFINSSTIQYRQHDNNVLGAKKSNEIKEIYLKIKSNFKNKTIKRDLKELFKQANSFKKEHYELLDENKQKILNEFCKIEDAKKLKKIKIIIKNKFYKQSFIKKIGELIFI